MVSRSCAHRADVVRRRAGTRARNDQSGFIAAGHRTRPQARRCRAFCRLMGGLMEMRNGPDQYQIRRTPTGRIASAFEPSPPEHHELARALAAVLQGEVRFENGSRALYATDASNYRQGPNGVVRPLTLAEVCDTV